MHHKSSKQLEKDLDKVFSLYVRQKNADFRGNVKCYTCGKSVNWKVQCDAGHYIKRSHLGTRWDERNVKPQCKRCNKWLNGNQDEFAKRLVDEYGADILKELWKLKHKIFKPERWWLETRIEMYKNYKKK